MGADIIPDRKCSKCGGSLWAIPMDVGYVEVICFNCDSGGSENPSFEEDGSQEVA